MQAEVHVCVFIYSMCVYVSDAVSASISMVSLFAFKENIVWTFLLLFNNVQHKDRK